MFQAFCYLFLDHLKRRPPGVVQTPGCCGDRLHPWGQRVECVHRVSEDPPKDFVYLIYKWTKYITGWCFQTWTLCSISYMGCHPEPIDELHDFSEGLKAPTSICNVCVHTWHDMTWHEFHYIALHTYGRWFHIVLSFNKTWGDQCQVVDHLWDDLKPAIQMGMSRYEDYEVWNGMKQQDSDHATIGHVTQQDTCSHSDWGTRRFDWQGLRLHCGHESETWFGYNVGKTMINHP